MTDRSFACSNNQAMTGIPFPFISCLKKAPESGHSFKAVFSLGLNSARTVSARPQIT